MTLRNSSLFINSRGNRLFRCNENCASCSSRRAETVSPKVKALGAEKNILTHVWFVFFLPKINGQRKHAKTESPRRGEEREAESVPIAFWVVFLTSLARSNITLAADQQCLGSPEEVIARNVRGRTRAKRRHCCVVKKRVWASTLREEASNDRRKPLVKSIRINHTHTATGEALCDDK